MIERLGSFFYIFFHFIPSSYKPVSEDRLVEAWRDVGLQQQPEQGVGVALGPGEYIDEIRFENDMIEFIFLFSPGMHTYYHQNMARQYFSPFSIFFLLKVDKTPGITFSIYLTFHTNLSLRIGLLRPVGLWGASSSLSREWAWHLDLENI